ncbi:MAG: hypothetical protein H6730_17750 [Deltaproteobacteria bacterium]|nr:hypothetical protein [Deltaproteobacteria bacterium]
MSTNRKRPMALIAACGTLVISPTVFAQDSWCFHGPSYVPSPTAPNVTDANVFDGDLGWNAAFAYHAGETTAALSAEAFMYSLRYLGKLYFGFKVVNDPAINPESDAVAVGVRLNGGTYRQVVVLPFAVASDCTAAAPMVTFPGGGGEVGVYVSKAGTVSAGTITYGTPNDAEAINPAWISGSRHCTVSGGRYEWRVELAIDLAAAGWTMEPNGSTSKFFASVFRGYSDTSAVAFSWPAGAPVGSEAPADGYWVDLQEPQWGPAKMESSECRGVYLDQASIRTNNGAAVLRGANNRFLVDVKNSGTVPADVTVTFKNQQFGLSTAPDANLGVAGPATVSAGTAASPGSTTLQTPAPGHFVPDTGDFGTCVLAEMSTTDPNVVFVQRALRKNLGFMSNPSVGRQIIRIDGRHFAPGPVPGIQQIYLETEPQQSRYTMSIGDVHDLVIGRLAVQDFIFVRGYRATGRRVKLGGPRLIELREPAGYFSLYIKHLLTQADDPIVIGELGPLVQPHVKGFTGIPTVPELYRTAPERQDREGVKRAAEELSPKLQGPNDIVGMHPDYLNALPEGQKAKLLRPFLEAARALEAGPVRPPSDAWKATLKAKDGQVDFLQQPGFSDKPLEVPADGTLELEVTGSYVVGGKPPCGCCCRKGADASPASGGQGFWAPVVLGVLLLLRFAGRRR